MERISEQKEFFEKLFTMLENQFPDSEIVLHDFSMPYEHTIVDIRNGHISGRKVGDCLSNYGLDVMGGAQEGMDKYNYITYLPSAKILRSSSLYFTNSAGKAIGCICINTDITQEVSYEDFLRQKNRYNAALMRGERAEVLPGTVQDLLDHLIKEAQALVGKKPESMTKDDKIQFLKYLDQKGAFLISKSGEHFCSYLGISKFTMYKYLDIIRNNAAGETAAEKQNGKGEN